MKKVILLSLILILISYASAEILITLNEPTDNLNSNLQTTQFVANISSEENLTNISLYGNFTGEWLINETNSTIETNETQITFTLTLDDGFYEWNMEACDINNTCSFSENNFTINIDTQTPQFITIINTTTNETAQINITTNEVANVTINYGETESLGTQQHNSSYSQSHTIFLEDLTHITLYYYELISCDEARNCNTTEIMNFTTLQTIDNEPPTWNQTPYSFTTNNETKIQIQYNASDNIEKDTYYINDTTYFNITKHGLLKNKTTPTQGNYSLEISVNDTSGNTISEPIIIEILAYTSHIITSVNLSSYEFSNNTEIEINVTVQKGTYDLNTVTVLGVQLNNLTEKNSSITEWIGLVNLSDNYMNATAIATDIEGFAVTRNSANYIINDTPPKIISIYPESPSAPVNFSSNVFFTFTANKNVTGNFTLDEDYQVNFTISKLTHSFILNGSVNRTILPAGVLTNGLHNITIYLEDEYGNAAIINHTIQIIDNDPPENLSQTITGTSTSSSSGTATITITLNEYSNCWISTSSSINASNDGNMSQHTLMTNSPGKTLTSTVSYSSSTTINRYISCRDLLGNNMSNNYLISFSVTISTSSNKGNTGTTNTNSNTRTDPRFDRFLFQTITQEEEKINNTPPVPQNISIKKIISIIGAQDLIYNEILREAIAEVLGLEELNNLLAQKLIKTSEEFTKNMELTRQINITENKTIITTNIKNKGQTNLTKFMIYDRIPKQFSNSTDHILTKVQNGQIKIVKKNPEYLIIYDEFLSGQIITYSYQVDERKDSSIIDMFSTELYAETNIGIVENYKKSDSGKIIGIIIWLQIIWISVFLFYYKKHHNKTKETKQKIK